MITLDDAIRLYTQKQLHTLRQRDRALVEALVWQMTPKGERREPGTPSWTGIGEFFATQGTDSERAESASDIKARHTLYRALAPDSLLWDEVEVKGMSLRTAIRVLRDAHRIKKQVGGALEHAVRAALDAYHGPNMETRKTATGNQYKVRSTRVQSPPSTSTPFARGAAHSRLFTDVRAAVEAYLLDALADMPEHEAHDARLEVLGEFDLAILAAARTVARAHHLVEQPRREEVRDACLRLGIPTPYNGRVPDMQAAKKAYRTLVLQLHPDRRAGSDDMRDALEATIGAYRTLEDYTLYVNNRKERTP